MTPQWAPENNELIDRTRATITGTMENPGKYVDPMRMAGVERINRQYRDMPGRISEQLAQRGYGASSELGKGLFRTGYERAGQLMDWDAIMAQMLLGEKNNAVSQGQNFMSLTRGTQSESETTIPGNSLAAGLLSGGSSLSDLGALLYTGQMPRGGIGGGGGGGIGSSYPSAGTFHADAIANQSLMDALNGWSPNSYMR